MAKLSQSEQFDRALSAILERRNSQRDSGPKLQPLLEVASALRGLPSESFKTRLKANLEGRKSMASQAVRVAEAHQSVTAYLSIRDAARAIDFYKKAFGATELMRLTEPSGKLAHAQIRIGNSEIMIADEYPDYGLMSAESLGGSPMRIHLVVDDVDALGRQAVAAGATVVRPIADQFYGYRAGSFGDPFGYTWILSTRKEDLSSEEVERRFNEMMKAGTSSEAGARAKKVKPIPEGFHTVTPYVMVSGGAAFIEFAKRAFGAVEMYRFKMPNTGLLGHAAIKIGDSIVELADATPEYPVTPVALHLYVPNTDELYSRALAAGASSIEPPSDKPYGDRSAGVRDTFGNQWFIATHIRDVDFEQFKEPAEKAAPTRNWIREGFHTVTPYITSAQAPQLIDFIKQVFDAQELFRDVGGAGGYHYEMKLGDSMLMVGGGLNFKGTPMPTNLWTYVKDVDATYKRALAAGGTSEQEPKQMPYGERGCTVKDAFGNNWYIATYNEPGATGFVREGLHTVTPYLHLEGAAKFIEFLKEAFGAEEVYVGQEADGRVSHAQIRIGDSVIAMSDATPAATPKPTMFYLYVEDSDALYRRAIKAGATSLYEPKDQPYGDHVGGVKDAMGNQWHLSTHIKGAAQ